MSIIVSNAKDIRTIRSTVMRGAIVAMQRADSKAKASKLQPSKSN